MKKRLSLLMVLMMVLSLVPMSVFATAGTVPGGLFSIEDTKEKDTKDVTVKLTQAAGTVMTTGAKAMLTLNKGEFAATTYDVKHKDSTVVGTIARDANFKDRAVLTINNAIDAVGERNADGTLNDDLDLLIPMAVYFDDSQSVGDVTLSVSEVTVSGNSTKIDVAKPIVIGTVTESTGDDMKVTVSDSTKKVGFDGGELSEITVKDIDENNTINSNNTVSEVDKIELELPDFMTWDTAATKVTVVGSANVYNVTQKLDANGNAIKHIAVVALNAGDAEKTLVVKPTVSIKKKDATKGDVSLKVMAYVAANKKETVTVTVGQVADFDVAIKAWEKGKKEIPAMYGGDEATIRVSLTGVKGSFTDDRQIDFTVKGADVISADLKAITNLDGRDFEPDGILAEDGEFSFTVNGTGEDELELDLKIKADYAQNGAVTIEADSRDFGKLETEIAKVTPAYTVETKVTSIKKGEALATADIVIKEAKAGLIDSDKFIVLNLNDKNRGTLTFSKGYKVETTNGMKVEDELFDENADTRRDLNTLALNVKTASTKEASTITISNVMVSVDGATVDGEKMLATNLVDKDDMVNAFKSTVKIDRSAAVEYVFANDSSLFTAKQDAQDPDFEKAYVNVVKEYGSVATTTVFKIGSKEYTVNGEAKTANEAPYVSGKGYTMLPVRALGEALGLKADWNAATKTATFSNDAKVASVVIGADTMYVNGTPVKLAAKAEIKNGSTFVELRSLASAFLVELEWDAATKSVTIKG